MHPFEGETIPIDPEAGRGLGKYSWAKSPRYDIGGGLGNIPLEAGPPLARRMAAGGPNALPHQDNDPLFPPNLYNSIGPSVFVRQMARMHEAPPKYYKWLVSGSTISI